MFGDIETARLDLIKFDDFALQATRNIRLDEKVIVSYGENCELE